MARGLSLPAMLTEDAAEAQMIAAVLTRLFTFMRGIPEERKNPIHCRDTSPGAICLAVLQRILTRLHSPEWFRQELKFDGLRPMGDLKGYAALKICNPDVTSVYAFFILDLSGYKDNELSGRRANVFLHAVAIAGHSVVSKNYRYADGSHCVAASHVDVGYRSGASVDGGSCFGVLEGEKFMSTLQSAEFVVCQHGHYDPLWLLTGYAVLFSRHSTLCKHCTAPDQDSVVGGDVLQLEKAWLGTVINGRNMGIFSTDSLHQIKGLESASYNKTGPCASQGDDGRQTALVHFGVCIAMLNMHENVRQVLEEQRDALDSSRHQIRSPDRSYHN